MKCITCTSLYTCTHAHIHMHMNTRACAHTHTHTQVHNVLVYSTDTLHNITDHTTISSQLSVHLSHLLLLNMLQTGEWTGEHFGWTFSFTPLHTGESWTIHPLYCLQEGDVSTLTCQMSQQF